jgi:hypothetical protein
MVGDHPGADGVAVIDQGAGDLGRIDVGSVYDVIEGRGFLDAHTVEDARDRASGPT